MENLKTSKLINFVTFMFSLFVTLLVTFPIANELDSTFTFLLLIGVNCVAIVALETTIKKKIYEHINSEIKRHKNKHVSEFFNYIESDKEFSKNVLRQDIPILNDDNEKIGTQTIYSALSDKRYKFQNK
jgi:hypothetical protein